MNKTLIVGCSFTDPLWQDKIPWAVEFAKTYPSYIVAKAGMGIKGITTEAMYYLEQLPHIETCVIILPTLWRMDIETSEETYMCTAMVDLLKADASGYTIDKPAKRKWITSGGLHYDKNTKHGNIFNTLYKHQGLLVILKEHLRSLQVLINYCKMNNIRYYISAIADPAEEVEYYDIKHKAFELLNAVEYKTWFRFNGMFINRFLKHDTHPTNKEHICLSEYIINNVIKGEINGQAI